MATVLNKTSIEKIQDSLTYHGRTLIDSKGRLHLNWTCAGISFMYTGSYLIAEIEAEPGIEQDFRNDNPFKQEIVQRETWPYLAVFVDDSEDPVQRIEISNRTGSYTLFVTNQPGWHKITIRKLTENPKGKTAICSLAIDGEIKPVQSDDHRLRLEFIGDSITCGFGNATHIRDRAFYADEEDGWMSHAAIAGRILNAETSLISYSGIAIMPWGNMPGPMPPAMKELYPYTDRLAEELTGQTTELTAWDFESHKPDVIILNLGTNDATVIEVKELGRSGMEVFEAAYYEFLQLLREKNGPDPWIICSLGTMDYFLYENICRAAKQFASDYSDKKVKCFKYSKIRFMDGIGASGHPNIKTHQRMGEEIAAFIRELLNDGGANGL